MKKNQIALLFLTLVVMLAVWYIKSPLNNEGDQTVSTNEDLIIESTRLDAIVTLREEVMNERDIEVAELDAIIASADTSVLEKETAITQKKNISNLTEKEVMLETQIMNMGYEDAFVHSSSNGVEVIIVSNTPDDDVVLEIITEVMDLFENTVNVVVNFQTVDDL